MIGFEFEFITILSDYKLKKLFKQKLDINFSRNDWRLVNDLSIITRKKNYYGKELISPPMHFDDGLILLKRILELFQSEEFKINTYCGLHINLDIDCYTEEIDPLSLIMLINERELLTRYRRSKNDYCASFITQIKQLKRKFKKIKNAEITLKKYIQNNLNTDTESIKNYDKTYKKYSINFDKLKCKTPYIEFRMIGGTDYCYRIYEIVTDINNISVAMFQAADLYSDKTKTITRRLNLL